MTMTVVRAHSPRMAATALLFLFAFGTVLAALPVVHAESHAGGDND